MSIPTEKEVLTTGEVAKICNVAPRTVSKWFDSGQLKGYRIPGSKDRRIPMSSLLRFMRDHGIPMEGVGSGQIRVLVVDGQTDVVDTLDRLLKEQTSYDVSTATDGFRAGLECARFKPHVMLLDLHIEGGEAREIIRQIHGNDDTQMTRIIAMSGKLTDGQAAQLRMQGFDGFLKKPFQMRQVVDAIEQATNLIQ